MKEPPDKSTWHWIAWILVVIVYAIQSIIQDKDLTQIMTSIHHQ